MGLFNHEQQQSQKRKKKMYNNPSTSLIHVMNLFEEKSKYAPLPLGPLPIKANGAIVVHRPTLHQKKSHQDIICFIDDEEEDDEEESVSTPGNSILSENSKEEEEDEEEDEKINLIQILSKENTKLKHRLFADKVEKEKLAQELYCAQQKIKQLERINQRFEKIILVPKQSSFTTARRQSTNSISQMQQYMSSENKIQILLDEIDSMEKEQLNQAMAFKKILDSHSRV